MKPIVKGAVDCTMTGLENALNKMLDAAPECCVLKDIKYSTLYVTTKRKMSTTVRF